MSEEIIWMDFKYRPELYEISSTGKIRSKDWITKLNNVLIKGKILRTGINRNGYEYFKITANGKKKTFKMHRVIGEHFLPNPENKPEINHKDFNKVNNNVDNLEWVTPAENMEHAWENGRVPKIKLRQKDILFIRENFQEMGVYKLMEMFKTGRSTIYGIATNRTRNFDNLPELKYKYRRYKPYVPHTFKKVVNIETGEIYESAAKVAELLGVNTKWLTRRLCGERPNKTTYQYLPK